MRMRHGTVTASSPGLADISLDGVTVEDVPVSQGRTLGVGTVATLLQDGRTMVALASYLKPTTINGSLWFHSRSFGAAQISMLEHPTVFAIPDGTTAGFSGTLATTMTWTPQPPLYPFGNTATYAVYHRQIGHSTWQAGAADSGLVNDGFQATNVPVGSTLGGLAALRWETAMQWNVGSIWTLPVYYELWLI